jgi:hypothetical protein
MENKSAEQVLTEVVVGTRGGSRRWEKDREGKYSANTVYSYMYMEI